MNRKFDGFWSLTSESKTSTLYRPVKLGGTTHRKDVQGRRSAFVLGIFSQIFLAAYCLASPPPLAVSPGSLSGALITDACPTFSWGSIEGAVAYKLAVFSLSKNGEPARRVLRRDFMGVVTSWTPSLDLCLDRGTRYAWSVRAIGVHEASDWASPNIFEIVAGPSKNDLARALTVVEEYLRARREQAEPQPQPAVDDEARWIPALQPGQLGASAKPQISIRGTPSLAVDGLVSALSFSGDGSELTNVNAVTASELSTNGADCSSGAAPEGVDAAGNVEGCSDVATQAEFDVHSGNADAHREHASLEESLETDGKIVAHEASEAHDGRYVTQSDLLSTSPNLGASLVGIEDSAGNFAGDNVEEALAELATGGAGGLNCTWHEGPNRPTQGSLQCPSGIRTGGGCRSNFTYTTISRPIGPNGWECYWGSTTSANRVYVVCCTVD